MNIFDHLDMVKDQIKQYGFNVQAVVPFEEGQGPLYAYTTHGPKQNFEVLIIGVPANNAYQLLVACLEELALKDINLDDQPADARIELTQTANMVSYLVRAPSNVAVGARVAFALNPQTVIWQLVWPDPAGRFPWDSDMDAQMCCLQGYGDTPVDLTPFFEKTLHLA